MGNPEFELEVILPEEKKKDWDKKAVFPGVNDITSLTSQ